jgi:hypothetical protein
MAEEKTTPTEETVDYKAKFEELTSAYEKLKTANDKTSSEVADYKRRERERMGEEEKAKVANEEREAYYKSLEKENAKHRYTAKYGGIISDAKVLDELSTLMAEGDYDRAIELQVSYLKKQKTELEKEIRAELLRQNPQPSPENGSKTYTKAEIMAIPDAEVRQRLIAEHIDLFR